MIRLVLWSRAAAVFGGAAYGAPEPACGNGRRPSGTPCGRDSSIRGRQGNQPPASFSTSASLSVADCWVLLTFDDNGRMSNIRLSPEQWARILDFLRGCTGVYVGQETDCRRFVEAVLWINRSGGQWRLLPDEYGNWNTVYKRFARWTDQRVQHEGSRERGRLGQSLAVHPDRRATARHHPGGGVDLRLRWRALTGRQSI